MGDLEDFKRDFLPRFIESQRAFHDGDAEPNIALWTTTDPVILLAARGRCDSGTEDVTKTFRWVASEFSGVRDYEWELLASGVSGDQAYTVAIERYWASFRGGPQALTELRATHVFAAKTESGGRCTAMPTTSLPTNRRPPDLRSERRAAGPTPDQDPAITRVGTASALDFPAGRMRVSVGIRAGPARKAAPAAASCGPRASAAAGPGHWPRIRLRRP
jgi:ketosteroid isomerase-like protein